MSAIEHCSDNGRPYSAVLRYTRQELQDAINRDADCRISLGDLIRILVTVHFLNGSDTSCNSYRIEFGSSMLNFLPSVIDSREVELEYLRDKCTALETRLNYMADPDVIADKVAEKVVVILKAGTNADL